MDGELRTYLTGMEQRMLERIDQRILDRTQGLEQRILHRMQEMVRDAQTEILRGFQRYLEASQVRFRSLEPKR